MTERTQLKNAIAARAAAIRHRDEAADALRMAAAVLASAEAEREKAQTALATAETERAKVVARAIRSGAKADVAITPTIKSAQTVLADAESRVRMARAAKDEIAREQAEAEAEIRNADAAITRAAESVMVSEVEARCSLNEFNAALAKVLETDELVCGVGLLQLHGITPKLTSDLDALTARLRGIHQQIGAFRPSRPPLMPAPENFAMQRFRRWLVALAVDADAKLDDIVLPPWEPPALPPVGRIVEDPRVAAARLKASA